MKRFGQWLSEIFDKTPKAKPGEFNTPRYHVYTFDREGPGRYTSKRHFGVYVSHNADHSSAHVNFADDQGRTGITGGEGHHAHEVIGGVHNVMRQHLERHPSVKSLRFRADNAEPSRVRLYHHLAKRVDPKASARKAGKFTHFFVRVNREES